MSGDGALLRVGCGHCGAAPGEPCRSVGGRPIVAPHMQRLRAALGPLDDPGMEGVIAAARDAYARAVVEGYFGYSSDALLDRARKDRSLDDTKAWVRRALQQGMEHGR